MSSPAPSRTPSGVCGWAITSSTSSVGTPPPFGRWKKPRFLKRCPICGDPATSDEHVPRQQLGGQVRTRTCHPARQPCGASLVDWYEEAVQRPGFRFQAVRTASRGPPFIPEHGRRRVRSGSLTGRGYPEITAALASGIVNLDVRPPNRNRYMLALLKGGHRAASLKVDILHAQGPNRFAATSWPRRQRRGGPGAPPGGGR